MPIIEAAYLHQFGSIKTPEELGFTLAELEGLFREKDEAENLSFAIWGATSPDTEDPDAPNQDQLNAASWSQDDDDLYEDTKLLLGGRRNPRFH